MAKRGKGFLGLGWIISLVLILVGIGWILSLVERILRGNIIGAVVTFFGYGFGILAICDIVTLIVKKDITILA